MLYPSAFRSLVGQTRKALENDTLLAGHSYCASGRFGRGMDCTQTVGCGDDGVMGQGSVQYSLTRSSIGIALIPSSV
jgi:hypothetical protein